MTRKYIDITGKQFGRLQVIKRAVTPRGHGKEAQWEVHCKCGQGLVISGFQLRSGRTRSCGCLRRELTPTLNLKHGHKRNGKTSPEYRTWCGIVQRCTNPKNKDFKRYGGRGIQIAKSWKKNFTAFLAHIGEKPSPTHQIDRIDNSRGYEPGNVRWATPVEQQRNRGNLRMIQFRGEELCLSEWAERLGISGTALSIRLKKWDFERALTESKRTRKKKK